MKKKTRGRRQRAARRPVQRFIIIVLAIALGLISTLAIRYLSQLEHSYPRSELIGQLEKNQGGIEDLTRKNDALQTSIEAAQKNVLGDHLDPQGEESDVDRAGMTALQGPGVIIALDNPRDDGDVKNAGNYRVTDMDIRQLVNVLWQGGARGVAINDIRLSSTATVRSAGEAILVDLTPLTPPYEVKAVGEADNLGVALTRSSINARLTTLISAFGMTYQVSTSDELSIPQATPSQIEYASSEVREEPVTKEG
ncbi:MAG: DUF881 domain-containing protein [Actinomycetaceae bacterium]|nr:DUF881 domain-containing protein [Actinomycetaceae bacterium]